MFNNQQQLPTIPKSWPGPWAAYKLSQKVVFYNGSVYLSLVAFGYIMAFSADLTKMPLRLLLYLLEILITYLVSPVILLSALRGYKLSFSEALDTTLKISLKLLAVTIMTWLIMLVSFLLLIVPFLFIFPRVILSPYYLIDQKLSPIEAIKASFRDSEGHSLEIWAIALVYVLFNILTLIIIGIYFSIIYSAALVVFYGYLTKTKTIKKVKTSSKKHFKTDLKPSDYN